MEKSNVLKYLMVSVKKDDPDGTIIEERISSIITDVVSVA